MIRRHFFVYSKLLTRLFIVVLLFILTIFNAPRVLAIDEFQAFGEVGSASSDPVTTLNIALTNPTSITVGHHLTLRMIISANRTIAISDPRGNVWQQDALAQIGTGTSRTAVFSSKITTAYQAGDEITINLTGGTAATAVIIDKWSGLVTTNWVDTSAMAGKDSTDVGANTWDTGNTVTTSQNKVLLLGTIGMNSGATSATPEVLSPVWSALTTKTSTTTIRTVAGHYRQINTTDTPRYAGTLSSSRTHAAIIVVYKLQEPTTVPNTPSTLTTEATHTNRVKLAWQDNATDENGFKIERAPNVSGSPGTYAEIASVTSNVIAYTDYGTSASQTYWYRVYAHNYIGNSGYSSAVSVTTPSGSTEGDNAIPVNIGIWINKSELNSLPITGSDPRVVWWERMKGAADETWPSPDIYNDGKANIYAMAGALTFARLKADNGSLDTYADAMRDKVRDAIQSLTQITMDTSQENTRPSRLITAYIIAADLIRLKDFDPQLDDTFRSWLTTVMYTDFNTGGGAPSLYNQCSTIASNTANMSRTLCAATFWYLGNQTELDNTALWTASFFGDPVSRAQHTASATPFNWQMSTYNVDPWSSNNYGGGVGSHYWQPTPGDNSTYYGLLPVGSYKLDRYNNQVNTDGIVPSDWGRNGPFVAEDSTYTSSPHDPPLAISPYNWTTLRGIAPAVVILKRAGYSAKDWGDQGLRRLMEANWRFYQLYSARDWTWTTNTINEWLPPLINYIYGTSYLNDFVRTDSNGINGQGENVGWTQWTMGAVPAEASSSSSASSSGVSCSDNIPTLFRIDANSTSAKIYFAPIRPENTGYLIFYGRTNAAEEYAISYDIASTGVIVVTIGHLNPSTQYYFKVRVSNSCDAGNFSQTMSVVTQRNTVKTFRIFDRYSNRQSNIRKNPTTKSSVPFSVISYSTEASSYIAPTQNPTFEPKIIPVKSKKICILYWCFKWFR